jgi:hypothetical protein
MGQLDRLTVHAKRHAPSLRWSRLVGPFGGLDKLDSGCRQAAHLSVSMAPYVDFR